MKELLETCNYKKVDSYIDVFRLSGNNKRNC